MKGSEAEEIAVSYLQGQQLVLVARNYRCRFGEIDLIMYDKETLVFIEVRMRTSEKYGGAAASITFTKRAKILRTARYYLAESDFESPCRFDVLLLSGSHGQEIEWLRDAFGE